VVVKGNRIAGINGLNPIFMRIPGRKHPMKQHGNYGTLLMRQLYNRLAIEFKCGSHIMFYKSCLGSRRANLWDCSGTFW
jgi:hypothetical protein